MLTFLFLSKYFHIIVNFSGCSISSASNTLLLTSGQSANILNKDINLKSLKYQSDNAQQHFQIQYGVKPFICNVCKKGFSTKGNLKNHYRIHTGEKPYKCNLCDHTSNHLSNLKKHVMMKHSQQL